MVPGRVTIGPEGEHLDGRGLSVKIAGRDSEGGPARPAGRACRLGRR
jgi:hypothetical protein